MRNIDKTGKKPVFFGLSEREYIVLLTTLMPDEVHNSRERQALAWLTASLPHKAMASR